MPDYSAGTASVRIRPNADDFVRDLNAKLKAVKDPGYAISVSANTGQASADIRRFRDVESRNGMKLGVDVALGQAQSDMAAFRARQRADGMTIKVDADTKGADTQIAGLTRRMNSLRSGRDALRLNIGAGLLAGVGPAVTGLASLASALQQVSGAALVVPGAIAGAAASIGTLAFGLSGISDAYKAVSTASESAGKDQAASARTAVSASNALRNAVVDEAQARKDVAQATRDARNELRDLHTEMRGGLIDESRAILQAQQARERLARGDYTDQRDALLDVAEADQRVLEVRQRNADKVVELSEAQTKGVAGSDQVVAANERLIRSQQQVTEASMAAAEAGSSVSAAQEKAMQEMGKLGPNAQKLVQTLVDMKPQFAEFRAAASEPLLEGKAEEFRDFYENIAPNMQAGMRDIATGWNQNITALFNSIGSDTGTGFIDRILGNTGEAQSRLTNAMDPMVRAIGTLSAAGSDALPRLADATAAVSERFATFLQEADADGRLDKWINEGLDGLTNLGNTVLNLGKALNGITSATGEGSFLEWLEKASDNLQKFLNSDEGQEKLKQFFADGRDLFEKWRPILEDIPGLMSSIHSAAVTYIGGVATVISPITELLREMPDLVKTAALAYVAWKTIDGVSGLLGKLGLISTRLSVDLPNAANKGAKGINRSFAGIAIPAALSTVLATSDNVSADQSAGSNLKGAATNVGGMALSGAMVGGAPGAIVGAIAGLGTSIYQRILSDIEEGRVKWESKWEADRAAGPNRPGSPSVANEVTGRGGVLQPSIFNPDGTPKPTAPNDLRQKIASGLMPGYSLNAQGQIVGPDGKIIPLPGFRQGGATPSGRGSGPTGGHIVEVHGDEWVLPKAARAAVGDKTLAALTAGRSFNTGGEMVDQYGNPVTPGPAPGGPVSAPSTLAIAPNPTAGGGGISGILNQVISGVQGPIGNALAIGQQIGGMVQGAPGAAGGVDPNTTVHGTGATAGLLPGLSVPTAGGDLASRAAGLPGLAGLFGSMASPDPAGALTNWGGETAKWVANWGVNTLGSVASTLWDGALGFFGLENSILSSSNIYNQAAQQTGQFFMAQDGPLGKLLGAGGAGVAGGGVADPKALGAQHGVDAKTLEALFGAAGQVDETKLQALISQPGKLTDLPTRLGAEGGLQVNTINIKRAIEAAFPEIKTIGGYRQDALEYHPSGRAIDIMIPGYDTPEGKALGDRINAFIHQNASAFGIEDTIWQDFWKPPGGGGKRLGREGATQGHYDHIHVTTNGGGYPSMDKGGPTPNYMGPVDSKGGHLAVVHPREFMISARGRSAVPDEFLHKLNQGIVDPKELGLRGYAVGGAIQPLAAAMVRPAPAPRPVVPARTMNPQPQQPRTAPAAPAPSASPAPSPAPSAPPAPAAPPQAPSIAAQGGAPAPSIIAANQGAGGVNHNVDWMNTLIRSSASNLGQLASTAMSVASMGGAGIPGMGAIGAAGPFVAGGIQQGGKVVEGIVNVVSSALVGSVPGSFGGKNGESPYGRVVRAEQDAPVTAPPRGGTTNNFHGISDINRLMDRLELNDKMAEQATLAKAYF